MIEPIGQMRNLLKIHISILGHIKEDTLRLMIMHFKQVKELSLEIDEGQLEEKELLELTKALINI